jgi:CDP-paratose 2-epimerase
MKIVLVTGSNGLVGSESVRFFCERGFTVVGIDNNMRKDFFGEEASTEWNRCQLLEKYGNRYKHHNVDIRDARQIANIFNTYSKDIDLVIHAAAQPSHDWAARNPITDFTVNAEGTLILLENTRQHCSDATFIFCSTNKVYGDRPNLLPLVEKDTRWEIDEDHAYYNGIDETMSIDNCKHSLFGSSKTAADIMVQEYGKYFGMKTACFRAGCITGPNHSGAELHGFLSYLMKCTITGRHFKIYGYKGKQVRDNIHSFDLVNAFFHFYNSPRAGEVYNIGGGRHSNCSILESIRLCEEVVDKKLDWSYDQSNRSGDHIWWITDNTKFKEQYLEWNLTYGLKEILNEMFAYNARRWRSS